MNLASEVYQLSPDDLERYDYLYQETRNFHEMVKENAIAWKKLRSACLTDADCRIQFLEIACNHQISHPLQMVDIPEVARYLCLRTEEFVIKCNRFPN